MPKRKLIELNKDGVDLSSVTKLNPANQEDEEVEQEQEQEEVEYKAVEDEPDEEEPQEESEGEKDSTPESVRKRKLILKINAYMKRFPQKLQDVKVPSDLHPLSEDELQSILSDIQFTVSASNQSSFLKGVFFTGVDIGEKITTRYTPYNLMGLREDLQADPEVLDILDELVLENADWIAQPPHVRLAYAVCMAAWLRSSRNKLEEASKLQLSRSVPVDLVNKYADL